LRKAAPIVSDGNNFAICSVAIALSVGACEIVLLTSRPDLSALRLDWTCLEVTVGVGISALNDGTPTVRSRAKGVNKPKTS
jgi:hypothetical protein